MTLIALLMMICLGNEVMGQIGDGWEIGDHNPRRKVIALSRPSGGDNDDVAAKLESNALHFRSSISVMRNSIELSSIFSGELSVFGELQIWDQNNNLVFTLLSYPSGFETNFHKEFSDCERGCYKHVYTSTNSLVFNLNGIPGLDGIDCAGLQNYKFHVIARIGLTYPFPNNNYVSIEPIDYSYCHEDFVVWPYMCYQSLNNEDAYTYYASDITCN